MSNDDEETHDPFRVWFDEPTPEQRALRTLPTCHVEMAIVTPPMRDADALAALIATCTNFRLGKQCDDDPRDYISVCRHFGVHVTRQWAVTQVSYERGMLLDTAQTFETQHEALTCGLKMLAKLRA